MDQGDSWLVTVLGLSADITHGLVQKNRDLRILVALCAAIDIHFVCRGDFHAHSCRLAIDQHPTVFNPYIGFTARTKAHLS